MRVGVDTPVGVNPNALLVCAPPGLNAHHVEGHTRRSCHNELMDTVRRRVRGVALVATGTGMLIASGTAMILHGQDGATWTLWSSGLALTITGSIVRGRAIQQETRSAA